MGLGSFISDLGHGRVSDAIGDIGGSSVGRFASNFGHAATRLTGNPLGIPGLDFNMIRHPLDIGHYAPLTKAAGIAGLGYLGMGGFGGGAGTAGDVMAEDPMMGDLGVSDAEAADIFSGGNGDGNVLTGGGLSGQSPGGSGVLDKLHAANEWMKNNKLVTSMGSGLVLGGLSAYGASQAAKRNAAMQQQMMDRFDARQKLMDNPPAYSGMNIGAPRPIDYANDPITTMYGQGPERRFFQAHGGQAGSGPMGGLHQMRMIDGGGGGQDDDIPAMLSSKEYVLDADTVAALGDGNPDHGARKLDQFRERLRAHKRSAPTSKIPPKARAIEHYMRKAA